jgi:hypothetical protein
MTVRNRAPGKRLGAFLSFVFFSEVFTFAPFQPWFQDASQDSRGDGEWRVTNRRLEGQEVNFLPGCHVRL